MNINITVTGTAIVTITITVIVIKKGHVYTHSYSKDTDPVITTFKFKLIESNSLSHLRHRHSKNPICSHNYSVSQGKSHRHSKIKTHSKI